jgi:hypothetical protein
MCELMFKNLREAERLGSGTHQDLATFSHCNTTAQSLSISRPAHSDRTEVFVATVAPGRMRPERLKALGSSKLKSLPILETGLR